MAETYTISDITDDLRKILKLTKLFSADDEGYWVIGEDKERFELPLGNKDNKHIVLVQDPMPRGDYLTFNPFSEGLGKPNPATTYYYKTLRVATNQTIMMIMFYVLQTILEHKQTGDDKSELTLSPAVVRIGSIAVGRKQTLYDVVDEDMLTELKKICERVEDTFIYVVYHTKDMTARVTCPILTDEEWDGKFAKDIRKKSVTVFKSLLMGILNISDEDELASFSVKYKELGVKSAPRFHTTMACYLKIYESFSDISTEAYEAEGTPADVFDVNLGEFNDLLERFPYAYQIAKHMVQSVPSSVKATSTATADTTGMRFTNMGQGHTTADGRQSRFSNPPIDAFGRPMSAGQGGGGQPMFTPQPQPQSTSRFSAPVLDAGPRDPFSPSSASRPMNPSFSPNAFAPSGGSGFGGGFTPSFGGSDFSTFGFNQTPSFNSNPPSTFGQPGTKTWFG